MDETCENCGSDDVEVDIDEDDSEVLVCNECEHITYL